MLGLIVLLGHDDRALYLMLTVGSVAVVPLAYLMARSPRARSRCGLHITVLGLYALSDVGDISFTDDRLDVLLRIMAVLLGMEVLWWVARAHAKRTALRLVSKIARFVVLPCALLVCTCRPMGALAGPIHTWRRPVVAEHDGPKHYEYVKVYDPSGPIMHFKVFSLHRPLSGLPFLERTLGVHGTGERFYDRQHEFEWRTADDGRRSLVITARACHDEEGRSSTCEGLDMDAVCFDSFEMKDLGTWPAVWPEALDSNHGTCEVFVPSWVSDGDPSPRPVDRGNRDSRARIPRP